MIPLMSRALHNSYYLTLIRLRKLSSLIAAAEGNSDLEVSLIFSIVRVIQY